MSDGSKGKIYHVQADIGPLSDHGFWVGIAKEGGGRGVFVATADPPPIGANVALTLTLSTHDKPLRIRTRVQWVVPDAGDGSPHGIGLAFISPSQDQMHAMQVYFKTAKPDMVQWTKSSNTIKVAKRQRKTIHSMPAIRPPKAPEPAPAPPPAPRDAPIKKLTIDVTRSSEHQLWMGFSEDIGEGGLFVVSQDQWELGQRVDVDLFLEGEKARFGLQCKVRWIRPDLGLGTPPGVGLDFVDIQERPLKALRRFVHAKDPEILFWDED